MCSTKCEWINCQYFLPVGIVDSDPCSCGEAPLGATSVAGGGPPFYS